MKKWILVLSVLAFFACETTPITEPTEPGEPFITLGEKEIVADQNGGATRVGVTSNCEWRISSAPKWVTVEKIVVDGKQYVESVVSPNDTDAPREASVWLSSGKLAVELPVFQSGKDKALSLKWYGFPVNYFTDATFTLQEDNVTRKYLFTGKGVFINPSIKSVIFPGSEIDRHTDNILEWKSYATNFPITVTIFTGGKLYTKEFPKPSRETLNSLAREAIAGMPQQSLSFSYQNIPMLYTSYRQLHLLGMSNLGLNLDEMVSGKPYQEQEMVKKTGLIYTYSNLMFNAIMDYPPASAVSKNPNTAYVIGVGYGKTASLLIETDHDYETARNVVNKIIVKQALTAAETQISGELDVYYLCFDADNQSKLVKGNSDLIGRFTAEINDLPIIPLNFVVIKSTNYSVGEVSIGLELP